MSCFRLRTVSISEERYSLMGEIHQNIWILLKRTYYTPILVTTKFKKGQLQLNSISNKTLYELIQWGNIFSWCTFSDENDVNLMQIDRVRYGLINAGNTTKCAMNTIYRYSIFPLAECFVPWVEDSYNQPSYYNIWINMLMFHMNWFLV